MIKIRLFFIKKKEDFFNFFSEKLKVFFEKIGLRLRYSKGFERIWAGFEIRRRAKETEQIFESIQIPENGAQKV